MSAITTSHTDKDSSVPDVVHIRTHFANDSYTDADETVNISSQQPKGGVTEKSDSSEEPVLGVKKNLTIDVASAKPMPPSSPFPYKKVSRPASPRNEKKTTTPRSTDPSFSSDECLYSTPLEGNTPGNANTQKGAGFSSESVTNAYSSYIKSTRRISIGSLSTLHAENLPQEDNDSNQSMADEPEEVGTVTIAVGAKPKTAPPLPKKVQKNPAYTGANKKQGVGFTRIRKMISQKRIRFQDGDFDLDLSYVTPQIIAMGLPAQGISSLFRNPISNVASMLNKYHPNSYMLLNLTENKYNNSVFNGQVLDIGWEDHHAPPFHLLLKSIIAAAQWMSLSPEHVVAVHCKAGKGRTGTVISALLVYAGIFNDPEEAFAYFAYRRARQFHKGGVTIPSQKRSVYSLASVLRGVSPIPRPMNLEKLTFYGIPSKEQKKPLDVYIKALYENHSVVKSSKETVLRFLPLFGSTSNKEKPVSSTEANDANDAALRHTIDDDDEHRNSSRTFEDHSDTSPDSHHTDDDEATPLPKFKFGTFPPHKPYMADISINLPINGDYLLKVKAKRPALLKQLNIFRIGINSAMLLPALDSITAEYHKNAVEEELWLERQREGKPAPSVPIVREDSSQQDDSEEEPLSPVYKGSHQAFVPATSPEGPYGVYTIALYKPDLDGAHKKKSFPHDFRLDIQFSEPRKPTLTQFDKMGYDNLVPTRSVEFWDSYTQNKNTYPQLAPFHSVYEKLWNLRKDYQTEKTTTASPSRLRIMKQEMTKEFLSATTKLKHLGLVPEKYVEASEKEKGSFTPNPLWAEFMSYRLRNEYSTAAQKAGLLPYEGDDVEWLIDNIRSTANELRKANPFVFKAQINDMNHA